MGEAGLWTLLLGGPWRCAARGALLALLVLAGLASPLAAAEAANLCLTPGAGAGQCSNPQGLATDFETERVYVADRGNHRIDVFEADGSFLFAFGWGVDTGAEELQTCTTASGCQAGKGGSGAGQLSSPEAIAVDNVAGSAALHDVYVTDSSRRVSRFEADGSFVLAFGWGVDTGAEEPEVCTTGSGCLAGISGGGECQLGRSGDQLAVGPGGNVFVADTVGNEPNFTGRVEKFSPAGECLGETVLVSGNFRLKTLTVDASEDAYVSVERAGGGVRKYDLGIPETELCELDPGIETNALAMDEEGDLFASQRERGVKITNVFQVITEYDVSSCPPTKHVRRFGYEELENNVIGLAALHTAEGDVFASEGAANPVSYLKYPPPGPIAPPAALEVTRIGAANVDVRAEVNPEGKETKYHFEYVSEEDFNAQGESFEGPNTKETEEQTLSQAAGDFRLNTAADLLACAVASETEIIAGNCLEPETTYRWRAVASNADGPGLGTAEGPPFETKGPIEFEDLWAMEVGTDAATLGAVVNPVGSKTSGHFEYVTEDQFKASGFGEAVKVPAGAELDFDKGEAGVKRTATLFPLQADTAYHYRIAATNPVLKASSGEDFAFSDPKTFRTFAQPTPPPECPANEAFRIGPSALLPDCRAYELVSPLDKANGDIKVLGEFTSNLPAVVNQSSVSGDRLAYGSFRAFAGAVSAPYTSQYIAARDPEAGWQTHAINPPQSNSIKGSIVSDNEYRAFSEDLCEGWITTFFEPILAPDAIAGYFNLYRRTDQLCGGEAWEAITTAAPLNLGLPQSDPENPLYRIEPQGHSAGGSVSAFAASDSLSGTGASGQPPTCKTTGDCRLRLYVKGEGLGVKPRFACVLPGGVPISAGEDCAAGSQNSTAGFGNTRSPSVTGALSEDGKLLFWSAWTGNNPDAGKLYLRENPLGSGVECSNVSAPCTRDVSKAGEFASGSTGAHFWQGALDGSAALYTTGGDLYRYVTATKASEAIAGEVLGLVGASEDVQRVYFASEEVLTGTEENEAGHKAEANKTNLYFHEAGEGGGFRFIGQLAGSDLLIPGFESTSPIVAEPVRHSGRVSPDGLAAAFVSAGQMTGYDNTDAGSGEADTEVFVYDASANEGAGELICASCNPTNGRPAGREAEQGTGFWVAARIPASYSTLAAPEVLAPDGQRLFFEATDALVPSDTNGRLDVYQWERAGEGSCKEGDATFSEAAGGCVDLISSGQSLADSEIVDASLSAAGADVFFNTLEGLLPQDYGLRDIYDARIGGGFEPPEPPPIPCKGESCRNPAAAPEFQTGATANNVGPGNIAPKKPKGCPKGKHKAKKNGKSRCVPNKKGSKGKRQGRAAR